MERLNKEVKRRPDVVGIFASDSCLVGAVLLEANDEWQRCYMGVEAMGDILNAATTTKTLQLPPKAA